MPLTVRLNKILLYAQQEAERLQNPQVLSEHLLLGIFRLAEGSAYNMLVHLGCNVGEAKQQLDSALGTESSDVLSPATRSSQVERILRIADSEAKATQADAVGSIHLLLAILHEHINRAAAYLESDWGITYDSVLQSQPHNTETPKDSALEADAVEDETPQEPKGKVFGSQQIGRAHV